MEKIRILEVRLGNIESPRNPVGIQSIGLATTRTEEDLLAISRLPDSVRDLQVFEGNPTHFISWIHNVESILRDYSIVRHKPIYRAILKHIRQKIRGKADSALVAYNIFDDNWENIKKYLSLHYADKRDIQSLENQLITMRQGQDNIERFYAKINHQLSLNINKIKADDYSEDGMNVLIENYRFRALDVFIRGLNRNLSQLVKVQNPKTLPEAYTACLDLQNMDFRKTIYDNNHSQANFIERPRPNIPRPNIPQKPQNNPLPQIKAPNIPPNFNMAPPRPFHPKPPIPMEVDPSIRTANVNYMNRPTPALRPSNESSNVPHKMQRMFNIQLQEAEDEYFDKVDDNYEEETKEETEYVNFMREASQETLI